MPLTDLNVRAAKAKSVAYRRADSSGHYLLIKPGGGKLWRLDYLFGGKRKTLVLGQYPANCLADARRARDDANAKLQYGIDPAETRRREKQAVRRAASDTFSAIAE